MGTYKHLKLHTQSLFNIVYIIFIAVLICNWNRVGSEPAVSHVKNMSRYPVHLPADLLDVKVRYYSATQW